MTVSGEILGVRYEGIPFGPGPGAINGTDPERILGHVGDLCRSPAGVIYYGSIPSRYNEGNRGDTYFYDPTTGEALNAMGLPSLGIELAKPIISEASTMCEDAGKVFIVSVSTLAGENAAEVLPDLVEQALEAGAHRAEVNYACPNLVMADGGRKPILGFDPAAVVATRMAIMQRVGYDQKIIEKLPPYLGEYSDIGREVARTYRSSAKDGVAAVCGFNTIPGVTLERKGKPVLRVITTIDGKEIVTYSGGLSGPALDNDMYRLQHRFGGQLPMSVDFIAANGVHNGAEVLRRTQGGACPAVAAVAVSAFWEGEKAGRSFGRTASQFAQEYAEALAA